MTGDRVERGAGDGPVQGMGRGKVYPASAAKHLLNPARRLVQPPGRVVRRMQLRPDARVLELGPGPGWFSVELARAVPQGALTLCDLQHGMVEVARGRTRDGGNVTWAVGDAMALPFADASFDAVLVATVLGEVPDRAACVREVRRVLAAGGVVTVSETRRDSDFIGRADLESLFAGAGFRPLDHRGPRWEYTARFT